LAKPKILYWDIETSPNEVYTWSLWQQTPLSHENIRKERVIICASWKWEGDSKVYQVSIDPDDPWNDFEVVVALHGTMLEADVVVHHNGDKFDMRWLWARMIYHKLPPLPRIIQIDTKKLAKKYFYFNSNRLAYLAQFFGIGAKIHTEFGLWKDCMDGVIPAIRKMLRYNARDVRLLEKVYKLMAPYLPSKLNYRLFSNRAVCKHCGGTHVQYRGYYYAKNYKYARYQCTKCGAWDHESKPVKE
jgi:hypothetical protein